MKKSTENGEVDGIQTLVGDQGKDSVFDSWMRSQEETLM